MNGLLFDSDFFRGRGPVLDSAPMKFLPGFLRGGRDELGWDDLVTRVVGAVAKLARFAARGRVAFPSEVTVRIEVGEGSVDVIRGFVAKPEFDAEVGAALANEVGCGVAELPRREYVVVAATSTRVVATESRARTWRIRIEGGDLDGREVVLPAGRGVHRMGRGPYHGAERDLPNDVVVCERSEFVSRRAARLTTAGAAIEVESLDQADALVVRRTSGELLRPSRTAKGRVPLRSGDVIELVDPRGASVRLIFTRDVDDEEVQSGGDRA